MCADGLVLFPSADAYMCTNCHTDTYYARDLEISVGICIPCPPDTGGRFEANETAFAIPGLQLSCTGCNCLRLLCLCRRLLLSSSQLLLLRSLCPRQVLSERCSLEQQHLHSVRQWQSRARLRHARVRPLSCVHLAGRGCPRISEPPLSFVLRTLATSSLLSQTSSSASARRACTSL